VSSSGLAVEASGLTKRYREKLALDGVDLAVPRGTVHGLLGPNGAGKTTAVRILTTLTRLDEGKATVVGHDVRTSPRQVRKAIGLTGQQTAVDDLLTARQNLTMFGRLFRLDKGAAPRGGGPRPHQYKQKEHCHPPPHNNKGCNPPPPAP
jgi:ABC-2 type transport system ATP-binding protein